MKRKILLLPNVIATPRSLSDIKKLKLMSRVFHCLRIAPVTDRDFLEINDIGGCRQNLFLYFWNPILRIPVNFILTVWKGLAEWLRGFRYEVIIATNPLSCGLSGLVLSKITGAKLIVEVNGNFSKAFRYSYSSESKDVWLRIKENLSGLLMSVILKNASKVKLLYPDQLNGLMELSEINYRIFHNFVPISEFIQSGKSDQKYVLLIGHPWHLKGVDVLINAFHAVSTEFPDYRLKIVGWCPDGKEYYERLAKGNPKIELRDPVSYQDVIKLMTRCSVFVLPSRTEAMGRVLLEAMASKKPIIASKVDGIPYIIKDGFNGLLFESENVRDLAEKLRIVLSKPYFAKKLASNGYRYVQERLSEDVYINEYRELIEEALED